MLKTVLGKGLDVLIPQKTAAILPKEFTYLPLDKIKPGKYQPRKDMNKKELEKLAQSIDEKGFIQPIVIRKTDRSTYEVVAGERRYQAAKYLGIKEIPTIIKDLNQKDAFVLAIVENLQREDLNPIEEAEAFQRLRTEFEFSLQDIGQLAGKDKTTIANTLRLLKLPSKIRQALKEGLISRSQARTILSADTFQNQEKLFEQILKHGFSVREIEKKARLVSHKRKPIDPFILAAEEKLQKLLGTKVQIFNRKKNRGRIAIEYYNLPDLERIIKRLER